MSISHAKKYSFFHQIKDIQFSIYIGISFV